MRGRGRGRGAGGGEGACRGDGARRGPRPLTPTPPRPAHAPPRACVRARVRASRSAPGCPSQTDGLFDALSNQQVVDTAKKGSDPDAAAKMLVQRAYQEGSCDNITCIVVALNGARRARTARRALADRARARHAAGGAAAHSEPPSPARPAPHSRARGRTPAQARPSTAVTRGWRAARTTCPRRGARRSARGMGGRPSPSGAAAGGLAAPSQPRPRTPRTPPPAEGRPRQVARARAPRLGVPEPRQLVAPQHPSRGRGARRALSRSEGG